MARQIFLSKIAPQTNKILILTQNCRAKPNLFLNFKGGQVLIKRNSKEILMRRCLFTKITVVSDDDR